MVNPKIIPTDEIRVCSSSLFLGPGFEPLVCSVSGWFQQHPNKKRKHNDPQDSQIQTRHPRFNDVTRPPQGPRGKYYNVASKQFTSQRIEYHDEMEMSTSRDHARSPWGTSSEGTPSANSQSHSEYFQREMARGCQGYRQQYPESSSIKPKIEESTQDQVSTRNPTNNSDATMDDITDVDSNDVARLETPLPMAAPTFPSPQIEQDDRLHPNDSVVDTDDTFCEPRPPMDNLPSPAVGEQGNDQDWEDSYEIEERTTEVSLVPQSPPQLAPASTAISDSLFNVTDDNMADVTANPWTS